MTVCPYWVFKPLTTDDSHQTLATCYQKIGSALAESVGQRKVSGKGGGGEVSGTGGGVSAPL